MPPPQCLKCKNAVFEIRNLRFDVNVKKQNLSVVTPCSVCNNCNTALMDNEQMNKLRKAAADHYREMHGLLSSKEIIAYREKLGLSQIAFARFLKVGEASIKRWETYYIQDESQNDHIRVKCDQSYSESNYFYLQAKYSSVDIYTGNKAFSLSSIRRISEFIEERQPEFYMHARKLHFYADFLHFKRHNCCITGLRYIPLKSGPSPHNYNELIKLARSKELEFQGENLTPLENETMTDVCTLFFGQEKKNVCALSILERGFLETHEAEFISYQFAHDLLI